MPTDMDRMQAMMAQMHAQNYMNDIKLAQYFQSIGAVFTNMAQGEYRMYQFHSGQTQGLGQPAGPQGQGMGQMPGMGQSQGTGQIQGIGQIPGTGQPTGPQAPGLGQPIGAGHGPGL